MHSIFNYFKSCFCCHEFEFVKEIEKFKSNESKLPSSIELIYMCKKCGYIRKIYS